jgi:hypothetical protein
MAHMYKHSYKSIGRRITIQGHPLAERQTPIQQRSMPQIVEHLPSKHEALSSSSSTIKKRPPVVYPIQPPQSFLVMLVPLTSEIITMTLEEDCVVSLLNKYNS